MTHTFNQFQKELRDKNIDPKVAYFLTLIYERLIETGGQLDEAAKLLLGMSQTMEEFVNLSEVQQREMRHFMRRGRPDGIEIESVANEPEDN